MKISTWLKIDLHIHSIESNKYKSNDYKSIAYDADTLINVLSYNKINLFSITDHNCINKCLYSELMSKRDILISKGMNFIIGCEIDIKDPKIHKKDFHALLFFDTDDLITIEKILFELIKNENGEYKYPTIEMIFDTFYRNNLYNFILIPHYNNKTKGFEEKNVVDEKMKDKKEPIIEYLNMNVFNAYEDSNSLSKIIESFNVYEEHGFNDLPIMIFSDCHDLSVYPYYNKQAASANEKHPAFRSILGNVNFPFNSLKTALQDARLRIGFDDIDGFRNAVQAPYDNYIERVIVNEQEIEMSPLQNTIIGGFGSGKSFF